MHKTVVLMGPSVCVGLPREGPCSNWGLARGNCGWGKGRQLSQGQGLPQGGLVGKDTGWALGI